MTEIHHRKVVAAVNPGDAYYQAVLYRAHELAQGEPFTVLSIFARPLQMVSDPLETLESKTADDRDALKRAIEKDVRRLGLQHAEVVVPLAQRADVGVDIVERGVEHQATALVLRTHGRTGLQAWVVGSVAQYVVRRASSDVYIVRSKPEPAARSTSS